MDVFICFLLLVVLVVVGILIFVNDPSKIKNLFQNVTDSSQDPNNSKGEKQEEYKPSQEETIRSIVKEEIERMGSKIIRSIPQPTSISQSAIINEIRHNRQLLERLIYSFDKRQENAEPAKIALAYPIIKFARMVDSCSHVGFDAVSLSDTSKGACYQIIINSETQGSYRIITDPAIMSEIISLFNPIVTSGCEYDEKPETINGILHIEDGTLELRSGIWCIIKKAKIRLL